MIASDVVLGRDVTVHHPELVNLYGCTIGDGSNIGAFVDSDRLQVLPAELELIYRELGGQRERPLPWAG